MMKLLGISLYVKIMSMFLKLTISDMEIEMTGKYVKRGAGGGFRNTM